jgi:Flp pilus assembly protein TadD
MIYKLLCFGLLLIFGLSSCALEPVKVIKKDLSDLPPEIIIDGEVEKNFIAALGFLNESKYDEAINLLKAVIEKEQRVPAPFINLAIAYVRVGQDEEAEKNLLKALDLELGHPIANNELGLLYRKAGRFDEAKKAYTNALTVHPNYLPARKNLGILCEIYIRDFECALEQFEEYQKYTPDDKTLKIWIADLKARLR